MGRRSSRRRSSAHGFHLCGGSAAVIGGWWDSGSLGGDTDPRRQERRRLIWAMTNTPPRSVTSATHLMGQGPGPSKSTATGREYPGSPPLDQRDRIPQRPLPPRYPGPGPLPQRAGREDLYLVTRSLDPKGTGQTRDHAMEASPERPRHHLRRPHASSPGPLGC